MNHHNPNPSNDALAGELSGVIGSDPAKHLHTQPTKPPLFPLGGLVLTEGFIDTVGDDLLTVAALANMHQRNEPGELDEHDLEVNRRAIANGGRVLSVFAVNGHRVYVITEADRSFTTLLMPNEY